MKRQGDISEDEIRIVGSEGGERRRRLPWWVWAVCGVAVAAALAIWLAARPADRPSASPAVQAQQADEPTASEPSYTWLQNIDAQQPSFTQRRDTVVDSIHLQIYNPVNATAELHVGSLSRSDTSIVLAAMAADLRRDNGRIVGAFVLDGEPLSWGLSKKGYCAIFDGRLTLGMADNSPLFEQATESGGSFFRQYPAVAQGQPVHNNPENASQRRALCELDGRVCVIACDDRVLMDDFSRALARLGVRQALFLVGGTAEAWYRDEQGQLGIIATSTARQTKYINYILFRKQ